MDSHSPLLALSKGGFGLRLGGSRLCLFKNRLKELDWEMAFWSRAGLGRRKIRVS